MNISPDDPRLTAFALGEIDDPVEAGEIEAAVAASPELQKEVEAIRASAIELEELLAAEPSADLSAAEKATIHAAATAIGGGGEGGGGEPRTEHPAQTDRPWFSWPWLSAAAAVILVGFLLFPVMMPEREGEFQIVSAPGEADSAEAAPEPMIAREDSVAASPAPARPSSDPRPRLRPEPSEAPALAQAMTDDYREAGRIAPSLRTREQPAFATAEPLLERGFAAPSFDFHPRPWPTPAPPEWPGTAVPWNLDAYDPIEETGFRSPTVAPLSTFSIDVDTAAYPQVRAMLNRGQLPPASAVRLEEMINYFPYEEDAPPVLSPEEGGDPFAIHLQQAVAPWAPEHRLLRVALKGYELPWNQRPPSNLVFLIDVSGSMNRPNRLPLVKEALGLLVDRLDQRDRVGIVVYAGSASITLPSTTANNTETIRHAIDQLVASGSTHASEGIQRAYEMARKHFIEGGNNRVILCTDGDFNVGITDRGELGEFVARQAAKGISLTVLGFGMGNYKDNMLETLSNKGKGVYGYIDTSAESRKFFLQQLTGNLFSIAHDVKIQVEFNPAEVAGYRLIGYENRMLNAEDFNDDAKPAGSIGPGHTVVAFYEIIPPAAAEGSLPEVDPLRYQTLVRPAPVAADGELATVKVRYKRPGEEESRLIVEYLIAGEPKPFEEANADFRFGAAVAAFGMRLRASEHVGDFEWKEIRAIALDALGRDPGGHRAEFVTVIDRAARLAGEE